MKKEQIEQTASRPATSDPPKRRPIFWVLLLCLLLGGGVVVTLPLLGGVFGRFSIEETNVIALVPPEEAGYRSASLYAQSGGASASSQRESGGQPDGQEGDLQVYDDMQTWDSETHVNLFQSEYGSTVKSGDGENVIAPGTTNRYAFTVKNDSGFPLDYAISLEVKALPEGEERGSKLPLEWRLLTADNKAVGDWQGYNGRTETLKQGTLKVRNQDRYTLEWRWAFEESDAADKTDTSLGDLAAEEQIGVEAVIYVRAEQVADETEQKPDETEKKPDETEQKPDETEDKPDETDRKPDETEDNVGETERKPDETEQKLEETDRLPDETDQNQPDTNQIMDETDRNQPDTGRILDDAGGSRSQEGTSSALGGTPRTGDTANLLLYTVLLVISAWGLLALSVTGRRRKRGGDAQDGQK